MIRTVNKEQAKKENPLETDMEIDIAKEYEAETGATYTDALTGLYNHGFFQVQLEREIDRSHRYGESFAVALLDIDGFEHYNKSHGPVKGDRLLRDVGDIIRKNIRKVDFPARFSGDQFHLILAKSGVNAAFRSAERIIDAVAEHFKGTVTVSIGIAVFPEDAQTRDKLLKSVSEALVHAKLKGKNTVHAMVRPGDTKTVAPESCILIVDDDPTNLKLLEAFLIPLKCRVIKAENGLDALGIINRTSVDLVLCDVMMPEMDGYDVCRKLKGDETTRLIPVVLVTALDDIEAKIRGIEAGADDFLTKPPNKMELMARARSLLNIKKLNDNLTSIEFVLFSMANAVEEKDRYTQGHINRVSHVAMAIGKQMGLGDMDIRALKFGGALHDIGKIGVPNRILNKPGPLDDDEWQVMKKHPEAGYQICLPLKNSLGPALDIILQHHEKLDGSGYPAGLTENDISMVARIMAVADIYDALVTDRPYRKAMPFEKAVAIINQDAANKKLDATVVRHLWEILDVPSRIDQDKEQTDDFSE